MERRNVAGFLYGGESEAGAALPCHRSCRCPKHRRLPQAIDDPGPFAALALSRRQDNDRSRDCLPFGLTRMQQQDHRIDVGPLRGMLINVKRVGVARLILSDIR